MSDPLALSTRPGLPEAMRRLLAERPRDTWTDAALPEMARFWLQMHDGFRRRQAIMGELVRRGEDGEDAAASVHPRLIQTLSGFLQHLDGHHRIETGRYFPRFRLADPRIAEGLDLLDRDHETIHAHLQALHRAGLAYHRAVPARSGAAEALAAFGRALDAADPALARHLDDEEEIVIPLICLHGADA